MKALLTLDNIVLFIGEEILFGEWENEPGVEKWNIDNRVYAIDNDFKVIDIADGTVIPSDVETFKYVYLDGKFDIRDGYVEILTPEQEIKKLREQQLESELDIDLRLSMLELGLV